MDKECMRGASTCFIIGFLIMTVIVAPILWMTAPDSDSINCKAGKFNGYFCNVTKCFDPDQSMCLFTVYVNYSGGLNKCQSAYCYTYHPATPYCPLLNNTNGNICVDSLLVNNYCYPMRCQSEKGKIMTKLAIIFGAVGGGLVIILLPLTIFRYEPTMNKYTTMNV